MNQTLRQRTYELLEGNNLFDRPFSRWLHFFLIALIIINAIAVIVESDVEILKKYFVFFVCLDVFSIGIFTIEYIARIWSSAEIDPDRPFVSRLKYACTPFALIDLIVILPYYLSYWFGVDLRMFRVLRLLRILKFGRYFSGIGILGSVLKAEARPLSAALIVITMMIIIAASLLYMIERDVQPHAFGSIPDAMWWATVTLTTVGYGDVVPITFVGRIIGSCIMVLGVGIVALPAGMLAARFSSELHKRQRKYRQKAEEFTQDGDNLSDEDLDDLESLRIELCLTREETARIKQVMSKNKLMQGDVCPTCHRPMVDH